MDLSRLEIRALQPEYQSAIGRDLVYERTQNNGIDEIFFEYNNKQYVAYNPDQIDIADIEQARHGATLNGIPVRVSHINDELNNWKEQTWHTTTDALMNATPDGLGGAAAAAIAVKVGLGGGKLVKTAALAGFVTSFFKEAISITLTDIKEYGATDWNQLKSYTELQAPNFAQSNSTGQQPSVAAPAAPVQQRPAPAAPTRPAQSQVWQPRVKPQDIATGATVRSNQRNMPGVISNGLPIAVGQSLSGLR